MTNFSTQVIETLKAPEFSGDLVLAYLWNKAGQHLGMPDVMSSFGPVSEADVRHDAEVVLSRPLYAASPALQRLRAKAAA